MAHDRSWPKTDSYMLRDWRKEADVRLRKRSVCLALDDPGITITLNEVTDPMIADNDGRQR